MGTDEPTARFLCLAVALAHLSCTAYRLPDLVVTPPPDPSPALGAVIIDRSTLPAYLTPEQADAFLTRLRADLVSTGLFESVEIGEAGGDGAVRVRAEYEPRRCFAEPLGLPDDPERWPFARDIAVDNRSTPLALWGWVAGPISLLPGWSSSLPEEQERQNLRVAIQNAVTGV